MVTLYPAYYRLGFRAHASTQLPHPGGFPGTPSTSICGLPVHGWQTCDFMDEENLCGHCLRRRAALILQERRRHHEAVVLHPATPRTPT